MTKKKSEMDIPMMNVVFPKDSLGVLRIETAPLYTVHRGGVMLEETTPTEIKLLRVSICGDASL